MCHPAYTAAKSEIHGFTASKILETNQNNQSPLQVPVQTILLVHVHHHVHLPTLSQSTKATKIMVNLQLNVNRISSKPHMTKGCSWPFSHATLTTMSRDQLPAVKGSSSRQLAEV